MSYILDNTREILLLMNKNLDLIIGKYANQHTIKNFKGRTPYVEQSNSDSESNKDNTPKSKPGSSSKNSANNNLDFSSAIMEHQNNNTSHEKSG